MAHLAQCKKCLTTALITEAKRTDVHEAVDAGGCTCCPVDHHHGIAADGGTPCRPLLITLLPEEA